MFRMVTMHLGRIKQSHIEGFSNGSFGLTKQFSEVIGQAVCQHSFSSCPVETLSVPHYKPLQV